VRVLISVSWLEKETRTYIEKKERKKKHNKITNNGERLSVGITSHRQNVNVSFFLSKSKSSTFPNCN
jgi:hypothetical protein